MEMKLFGMQCRLEIIIICLIVGSILGAHLLCSCSKIGLQEGMAIIGAPLEWQMGTGQATDWKNKANKYASEMGYSETRAKYSKYSGTPVPLPEGELLLFADDQFKPECCPSTYTSSTGCSCITQEQVTYLNERGGNRTLGPTEY